MSHKSCHDFFFFSPGCEMTMFNAIRVQARAISFSSRTRPLSYLQTVSHSVPSILKAKRQVPSLRLLSTSLPLSNYSERGVGSQNSPKIGEPSATIWLGNIPFSADEADIRRVFDPLGDISAIRLGKSSIELRTSFSFSFHVVHKPN
jgi:RNA recognition motif-containing protein